MYRTLVIVFSVSCASRFAEALRVLKTSGKADNCECLGWQDAFDTHHNANCSGNHDVYVCQHFLRQLPNETFCINSLYGNTTQWCYVAPTCQTGQPLLWAADGVETNVLWNECQPDMAILRNKRFDDFIDWCKLHNLDVGVAAQFAYPQFPTASLFDVMSFWDLKLPEAAPTDFVVTPKSNISNDLKSKLQEQVDSNKTVFFTSKTGFAPFGVSEGKKFYWLNVGRTFELFYETGNELTIQPGDVTEVKCVHGCEDNAEPWLSPMNNVKR